MKDFDELAEGLSDLPEWNIMEDTGLERQIERHPTFQRNMSGKRDSNSRP